MAKLGKRTRSAREAFAGKGEIRLIWIGEMERSHGSGCPLGLVRLVEEGVTAFAAVSDLHALRAITELQQGGISIPGDVSVTGFDDLIWAGVIALALSDSAFEAEIFRAGIQSIPRGQFEACDALGLSFATTMYKVVLPQAFRMMIPPLASYGVAIMKDTSLASVVAMDDLLKQATDAQALFANPTPLLLAALIYIAILWPMVRFTGWLEQHFKRGYR